VDKDVKVSDMGKEKRHIKDQSFFFPLLYNSTIANELGGGAY